MQRQKTDKIIEIIDESEINKSASNPDVVDKLLNHEKISKTVENVKINNNESEISKSSSQKDKVNYTLQTESPLRRSARIKDMPNVSYGEEHCNFTNTQSVMCDIPNSYSEIKNRADKG